MLDSGDNEMRCPFGRRVGTQKIISKMTTIVYVRSTESLKKVAVEVKKKGQISERFKLLLIPTNDHCEK